MNVSKKYRYQVIPDNALWRVEILRRVTSRKTVVTKQRGGFSSETEAQTWGEEEIRVLLNQANIKERNKRHSQK